MDKIYVVYAQLGELSVAEWGILTYGGQSQNPTFILDEAKAYNYLRKAANKGANSIRCLPISLFGVPSKEAVFQPFIFDTNEQKWNVTNYNDYYFPILKRYIEIAKSLNLKVIMELYDNCGLSANVRGLNPWCVNIQGLYDFYGAGNIGKQYVAKMVDELGDSVLWALGNELTENLVADQAMEVLKEKGKKPWGCGADLDIVGEMTHSSVMKKECVKAEELWDENMKVQLFRPCHQSIDPTSQRMQKPVEWWAYHSIEFASDGQFPRPNLETWHAAVSYVLQRLPVDVPQYGQGGKARLAFEVTVDTTNLDLEASYVEAIVSEAEAFGLTFENKGKFPNDYVPPITDVNVRIQTLDEFDTSLVTPGTLTPGLSFITPVALQLKKDEWFNAKVITFKDDGTQVVGEQEFQATEGLLVTFRFFLHDCSCSYWGWNIFKRISCWFGGKKKCK